MPAFPAPVTLSSLQPGTIVSIPLYVFWKHRGIVSDRQCDGKPMVISGSGRAGIVCEESWGTFADGHNVQIEGYPSTLPPFEVLQRVRALVGTKYHLTQWNCDHVVIVAHGGKPESPQIVGTAFALMCGVFLLAASKR